MSVALPDVPVQRRQRKLSVPPTQPIDCVRPQSRVIIRGIIRSASAVTVGGSLACHLTLADASGELEVLFLGRSSVLGLQPGTRISVEGRVGTWNGELAMWNPRYVIEPAL